MSCFLKLYSIARVAKIKLPTPLGTIFKSRPNFCPVLGGPCQLLLVTFKQKPYQLVIALRWKQLSQKRAWNKSEIVWNESDEALKEKYIVLNEKKKVVLKKKKK